MKNLKRKIVAVGMAGALALSLGAAPVSAQDTTRCTTYYKTYTGCAEGVSRLGRWVNGVYYTPGYGYYYR